MASPDADIPPALQGDLSMVIVPAGRSWNVLRYPLGMTINDARLQHLPASLEIHGLSFDATVRIADLLSVRDPSPPAPSRVDLLRAALYRNN